MQPTKSLSEPKNLLLVSLVYSGFITLLFLLPGEEMPDTNLPKGIDKIVHVILNGVLFLCWGLYWFVKNNNNTKKTILIYTALACVSYGIIIEVLQDNFIPLRESDWADVLANVLGVAIGMILYYRTKKVFEQES